MFKKLLNFLKFDKLKDKEYIKPIESNKSVDKYDSILESYTMWCINNQNNSQPEGHIKRFDEGARTKKIFAKRAEKKGWKFTEGDWYCPTCKNKNK